VDQDKSITMDGVTDTIPLAFSQIRESDNIVKANSGQVIVIGGLMRERREKISYKMPGLGSLPGLGRLFRSERDVKKVVELVILLRPIVVDDGAWQAIVDEQMQRIEQLEKQKKVDPK
jgi:MSHA biogenesis protein MshL